jgi:hypothetical protein
VFPVPAQSIKVADDGTILKEMIIFGRHSIRSSTHDPSSLAQFAVDPYPDFTGVPTGNQLHNLTPLTLETPPASMQLVVPGSSKSSTNLDVKFSTFRNLLMEAMAQKYVQPGEFFYVREFEKLSQTASQYR